MTGRHPVAGAEIVNLSPAVIEEFAFRGPDSGVLIVEIAHGSPAARHGFQPGDLLHSIDGREPSSTADAEAVLQAGERPRRISIWRNGRSLTTVFR